MEGELLSGPTDSLLLPYGRGKEFEMDTPRTWRRASLFGGKPTYSNFIMWNSHKCIMKRKIYY
jgi:hypothetical protein